MRLCRDVALIALTFRETDATINRIIPIFQLFQFSVQWHYNCVIKSFPAIYNNCRPLALYPG